MVKRQLLFLFTSCLLHAADGLNNTKHTAETDFATSFVHAYDFFIHARDYREYHPFILKKAQNILVELEQTLQEQSFSIDGRMVICGYQEDAIPSYLITDENTIINDEYRTKTASGWTRPAGALMGFLVGYLFKNIPATHRFEHIAADHVELFNTTCQKLQHHAIGSAFALTAHLAQICRRAICMGDTQKALTCIYTLLKTAYTQELKDSAGTLLATQDTLFSIHHLKHILKSSIPAQAFFTGPDITYPIELLPCQKEAATASAQEFSKRFAAYIQKPKEHPTAYIFCSFVDGVGKSTLYGNMVNWYTHGTDIAQYTHVDNASSQSAQFFQVDDNTFLVDLPACMSHIVGKPDGSVYIEPDALDDCDQITLHAVGTYIQDNQAELTKRCKRTLNTYTHNSTPSIETAQSMSDRFIQTLALFDCTEPEWIPGSYKNIEFIFKRAHPDHFKILTPLSQVSSRGLKIATPEHMLFHKPYLIPEQPQKFMADLVKGLKHRGIEHIVFVDFISIYPRSSRETVRVNYLLQTIKHIFGNDFLLQSSVYTGIAHESELYTLIKKNRRALEHALFLETMVRNALYTLAKHYQEQGITTVSQLQLRNDIRTWCTNVPEQEIKHMHSLAHEKICYEAVELEKKFGHHKTLEAIINLDMHELIKFSQFMCTLCSQHVTNQTLQPLWQQLSFPVATAHITSQNGEGYALLTSGTVVDIVASWPFACHDPLELRRPLSILRAAWYATLVNLLYSTGPAEGPWLLKNMISAMPYALVSDAEKTTCYLISPHGTYHENIQGMLPPPWTDASNNVPWACIDNTAMCIDLSAYMATCNNYGYQQTYTGAQTNKRQQHINTLIDQIKLKLARNDDFIATSELVKIFDQFNILATSSRKSAHIKKEALPPKRAAQLCILALATLDLILKDSNADIMARRDRKADFSASVRLLEHMTLPSLFDISFQEALFEDYEHIEPVIPLTFG